MRPVIHPYLVNDPFGDPGLYAEFLYEKRALLFDLGDLHALPTRKLLRVSHVFVSHMHMDHFCGFDRLLRVCLGRDKALYLLGPPGLIRQVGHKLAAYTWNLVQNYATDLAITVGEFHPSGCLTTGVFRCQNGFKPEGLRSSEVSDCLLLVNEHIQVRTAVLDHGTPCLAFALEEKCHVNIWKNRVEALGFSVGPWLRDLKTAILREDPDDTPFRVWWRSGGAMNETVVPLGSLKGEIAEIVPGQKVVYVTDVRDSDENCKRIAALAAGADILFIEAPFLEEDAEIAARKNHLTAARAGDIARRAEVRRVVPVHFSPRYSGQAGRLIDEVERAFTSETQARVVVNT